MVLQVRTLLLESEKNFIQMEKKVSHLLSQKSPKSTNFNDTKARNTFWCFCFDLPPIWVTDCMSVIHRALTKVAAIPQCALCWILGDSLSITECEIDAGREGLWISNPLILAKNKSAVRSEKEPCGFIQALIHFIILLPSAWEPLWLLDRWGNRFTTKNSDKKKLKMLCFLFPCRLWDVKVMKMMCMYGKILFIFHKSNSYSNIMAAPLYSSASCIFFILWYIMWLFGVTTLLDLIE